MLKTYNYPEPGRGSHANLKRMAYFAAVVESGSFTAAAERLGVTKAVVSQQVARLEQEFRISLLTRTTRKVRPTEAGQAFFERCALILREAEEAFGELGNNAAAPSGLLKLTAPFDYGIDVLVPVISGFMQRYPQCKVEAIFSDQTLDLMASGIELAIRVGWLSESDLQARRIGSFRQLLVAAPKWRPRIRQLTTPEQLATLPFVANTALRDGLHWEFTRNKKEKRSVDLQAPLFLSATLAVREATLAGVGLSVLPDFTITDDLATGALIQVLPQWGLPMGGIHAVFPSARFRPPKVRAFVDLLIERQAPHQAQPAARG